MKFKTTPYHADLLKDTDRLSSFYEAITEYDLGNELAYDLGCGSGILSYFLNSKFDEIISIEIESKAANYAKDNLSDFSNIQVVNTDVFDYDFSKKADLIVCEMLDTALIDEEEVPVLNHVKKYLKENGTIIPKGIINTAEIVNMQRNHVHWDEGFSDYDVLSNSIVYSEFNFLDDVNPVFEEILKFKIKKDGLINGLKITTFTKLNDNIIAGPSPMLNPPLLIPLSDKLVNSNDFINVKLKYNMGNGIESIKTEYI